MTRIARLVIIVFYDQAIPPNIDKVANLVSDAKFVLLVEKDAAFMRLAEDRFYNRFPCVIITVRDFLSQ
jgi:meiotic recombination protein SPO11